LADGLAEKSEILNEGPSIEMLDPDAAKRNAATVREDDEVEELI